MTTKSTLLTFLLACAFLAPIGCDEAPNLDKPKAEKPEAQPASPKKVPLHVINGEGKLVGPHLLPVVRMSDDEWKQLLGDEAYRILRRAGTEQAGCGTLLDNKRNGLYTCAGCALPLFASDAKFKSGTGWPSFFQPVAGHNIEEVKDTAYGMVRTEIRCARCEGHLGHVFRDGPKPTGLRYCLNSEALVFTDTANIKQLAEPIPEEPTKAKKPARAEVVFAGGCFWCVEAVFEELDGVIEAVSGYVGGTPDTANYADVSSGDTKHAEAVRIVYDPTKISYEELLAVHFATHDATTLNRQGADIGPQYRSAIFYANDEEKKAAEQVIAKEQAKLTDGKRIVTTLEPLGLFHVAEAKHQDFVRINPRQGYVRAVALPKVEKVRAKFPDKLKQK
jgi:peptide methionine sulfoxide reductase msrA/msrB